MRILSAKKIAAAFSYATLPKGVSVGDVQATLKAYQAVVDAAREVSNAWNYGRYRSDVAPELDDADHPAFKSLDAALANIPDEAQ